MIKKFKNWLYGQYLPMWAKETLKKDLERLEQENRGLREKLYGERRYSEGLEEGLRAMRKITVNVGGNKHE